MCSRMTRPLYYYLLYLRYSVLHAAWTGFGSLNLRYGLGRTAVAAFRHNNIGGTHGPAQDPGLCYLWAK